MGQISETKTTKAATITTVEYMYQCNKYCVISTSDYFVKQVLLNGKLSDLPETEKPTIATTVGTP
jgi:predicted metal-binding protein